jgi:hypothetical protein
VDEASLQGSIFQRSSHQVIIQAKRRVPATQDRDFRVCDMNVGRVRRPDSPSTAPSGH